MQSPLVASHVSLASGKPSVLFITPTTPLLSGKGGAMRAGMHILALSETFDVHVLVLNRFGVVADQMPKPLLLSKMARFETIEVLTDHENRVTGQKSTLGAIGRFFARPLSALNFSNADAVNITELLLDRKFDLIFFGRISTAMLMENRVFRAWAKDTPKILDMDDIESDTALRETRTLAATIGRLGYLTGHLDVLKLRHFERRLLSRFDQALVCSKPDQATMKARHPKTSFNILPNGFQVPQRPTAHHDPAVLTFLFVGSLQYAPNIDGIMFFCAEVLPLLRQRLSQPFRLMIVGQKPPQSVQNLAQQPEITVTGRVPDVDIYYHSSTMAIVPIRFGGGTRIKILESMALGCPVVSTTLGAEGIDVTDGENIILADTAGELANACIRLAENAALRAHLSQNGWETVNENYSVEAVTAQMTRCVNATLDKQG